MIPSPILSFPSLEGYLPITGPKGPLISSTTFNPTEEAQEAEFLSPFS